MENKIWKDATSYSQREKDRTPRAWELVGAPHGVTVHRHIMEPDAWFVTCHPLDISAVRVSDGDSAEARDFALCMVMKKIAEQIAELHDMYYFVCKARYPTDTCRPTGTPCSHCKPGPCDDRAVELSGEGV